MMLKTSSPKIGFKKVNVTVREKQKEREREKERERYEYYIQIVLWYKSNIFYFIVIYCNRNVVHPLACQQVFLKVVLCCKLILP